MKHLALAALLSLAALPAWADEWKLWSGSYLICIGMNACSEATGQHCSVALGKNVQFPEGRDGDHILATREGVRPLLELDDITVARINAEMTEFGRLWKPDDWHNPQLDPQFVKEWNEHCGAMS